MLHRAHLCLIAVIQSSLGHAAPAPSPIVQVDEVVISGATTNEDPRRQFYRASARYTELFNKVNPNKDYKRVCGNPETFPLNARKLFCRTPYLSLPTGSDSVSVAERARRHQTATDIDQQLRSIHPELQKRFEAVEAALLRLQQFYEEHPPEWIRQ